ncbi:hypothetical protein MKW98_013385 [Papaver atlanticum]|uniref:F-box domain-containing protein n=1 Tax=Papaver atlanticum TaxID=357466 RepID=A0AAD4SSP0_9MAGN|nr:hypothetical protein MKW98_013385 [Papaver atlanticum]
MINLAAALKRRRLREPDRSSNNESNGTELRDIFEGKDLIFNTLSRLPLESLMKFKSVCKRWRYLIKYNKHFISLHLTLSRKRLLDENTFMIYPTLPVYRTILPIKKFMCFVKDLKFDDNEGGSPSDTNAVVTSHNVTLEGKGISILEPVHGLICFVKGGAGVFKHRSVLIYNPSTREKTSWIETLTSAAFRNLFGVELVEDPKRSNTSYHYMSGFGIDLTTNQHKVLCILKIIKRESKSIVKFISEWCCGVLTVGENTWRKIEQVPRNTALGEDCVHVRGSIYWLSDKRLFRKKGVIRVFDLRSETFRLIEFPNVILDCWKSTKKLQLVHELAEIDGCLAILVRDGDDLLKLWIYNVDKRNSVNDGKWIEETMQLPCRWDKIQNVAFKAITGTSLVVIKFLKEARFSHQFRTEVIQYYDRREKKFYKNSFEILLEPSAGAYSITPFFETLLPVQSIQMVENNIEDKLIEIDRLEGN